MTHPFPSRYFLPGHFRNEPAMTVEQNPLTFGNERTVLFITSPRVWLPYPILVVACMVNAD